MARALALLILFGSSGCTAMACNAYLMLTQDEEASSDAPSDAPAPPAKEGESPPVAEPAAIPVQPAAPPPWTR